MKNLFLGNGLKFPFAINDQHKVAIVSNENDIKEAIKIILKTSPGERVMRPDFGCGINNYTFSVMNSANIVQIQNEIERALTLYEPRIVVESVDASVQESPDGVLHISIEYKVKSSNARHNLVYPFYLREEG